MTDAAPPVIVAVASPPGRSVRGIVRLSGRGACGAVAAILDDGPSVEALRDGARGVRTAMLRSPPIPVLVVAMPGSRTATGEDCAEIHLPGNPVLLERVVDAIVTASRGAARRAHPGEFSVRAVLNGRAAIADVERVAASIAAETDAQWRAARGLDDAAGTAAVRDAADGIADVLALVEAGIDFTDQEGVEAIPRAELERRVGIAREALRALSADSRPAERGAIAPRVTLLGPPNAGKSTLFNALLGRPRAVAHHSRGTTRDAIEEPLVLPDGAEVILVDAPGIEDAAASLDLAVQDRAAEARARADIVLECIPPGDGGAPPGATRPAGADVIRVLTKRDTSPAPRHAPTPPGAIATSARDGTGIDALRDAIARCAHERSPRAADVAALGDARAALVREAVASLDDALREHAPELVAAALRTALDRLGEVAGAIPPDDVLGRLFSRFCIGK